MIRLLFIRFRLVREKMEKWEVFENRCKILFSKMYSVKKGDSKEEREN